MRFPSIQVDRSTFDAARHIGAWFGGCRRAAGLSQRQTAERAEIHKPHLTRAERTGVHTIRTLIRLAASLDCAVEIRLVPHPRREP